MLKRVGLLLLILSLVGCNSSSGKSVEELNEGIQNPVSESQTIENILLPLASQVAVKEDELVKIDYSNVNYGYIMVSTQTSEHARIKIQIIKDEQTYNYDLNKDQTFEVYPLNMGSGSYTIRWLENLEGTKYALVGSLDFDVNLENELIPYLYPSQYVDYTKESLAVKKSFELCKDLTTDLQRVYSIYSYVTSNVVYDWDKVDAVQGKFVLPIVDETLTTNKGICFDYASLMATMLRVQHIPTQLVTGMVEDGYHAWVEVYIDNIGWIAPHIYFKENDWTLIDATFDAMDKGYEGYYEPQYHY